MKDLTKGPITKTILQFMLPIFIGNLFNLAYNLADTRIIGTFYSTEGLAAIGSVSTLSDLIVGFTVGIANGFAVVTARYYGMGRKDRVQKAFIHAMVMGTVIAGVILAFCLSFLNPILDLLHVMPEHREASISYISVILLGLFFSMFYNVLASSLRAIGDAYTPLKFLILSACINVGLDLLLVGGLHFGVKGAALATIISQLISAVLCFRYTWKKYEFLHFTRSDFRIEKDYMGQMLPAAISMALMNSLVSFGTVTLQSAINTLGTNTIVAHAATRKLTNMFMLPFSAFGTTMATFAGQNYGAKKLDRIKGGLLRALGLSYAWAAIVQLMTYTISPYLIVAITDTKVQEVIETAVLYQKVDCIFYICVPTISILRNSLQGMGDHRIPIISSSLELIGKVIFAFALTPVFGYWAIIWSEPVVWIVMVMPLIYSMIKRLRKSVDTLSH